MQRRSMRGWAVGVAVGVCAAAGVADAAASPKPVPPEDFRLVVKDVEIRTDGGAVVERHHCEWTVPQDDDRPCLRFSGDPQGAIAAILAAGGDRAVIRTSAPDIGLTSRATISRRANGQWLTRGDGEAGGRSFSRGAVCSADGETCTAWDAAGARSARAAVRAAAARVRRQG